MPDAAPPPTYRNPGKGKRRARVRQKGRQPAPGAIRDLRRLLGSGPHRRDLLLEYLHVLHDAFGHISAAHIAALAEITTWHMAEIFEVASFYAHLDIVKEGEDPPPPLTVRVCDGLSCELAGAKELREKLQASEGGGVRIKRAPCMGRCDYAPVAAVGRNHVIHAKPDEVSGVIARGDTAPPAIRRHGLADYRADGGLEFLAGCYRGDRTPDEVIGLVEQSGLRGLGGAGFPAGRKWRFVRAEAGPRLMVVNADEGEPGTFKDRHILETGPFRFLEGMLIAAWTIEAEEVYIYLRDEYPQLHQSLAAAIAQIADAEPRAPTIHLRRGAGAYICGEESAMLESLEGRRGLPRHRPPYASQVGLFGRPTLINNVETLYFVRDVLEMGPDWYAGHGRRDRKGLRFFSLSGRVREPGVKLAPAGVTVRELIEEFSGGMAPGHTFHAYLPGGASGGILPASMGDIPLDFGTLEPHGSFIGSAGVVILSDQDDVPAAALNLMHFFADESCGQCTPCRVGTEKAAHLMAAEKWDAALLTDLCDVMADASICGLGQAAPNPVRMVLKHFPEEVS